MRKETHVIKPREAIEATFLQMMKEMDFSEITVSELIGRSRIAKGTFYYHFKDKYDLAEQIMKKQLDSYNELFDRNINVQDYHAMDDGDSFQRIVAEIVSRFSLLAAIHAPEFDGSDMLESFLCDKFQRLIEESSSLHVDNSLIVSRMLAAMVITQIDLLSSNRSKAGASFVKGSLKELIECLRYFYNL